jgi:Family of unknown function (DUF6260)
MALERIGSVAGAPNHIAQALLRSNLSIPELRALSPLEENAQRIVDQAVVSVGLERLVIAADIMAAGLTFPLTDPLSVMEVQWERTQRTGGAQRTMMPQARGEYQLPDRSIRRIPVYLTTDDFSLNIRTLKMSERIGAPLDTTLIQQATRRVNEAIEDATINGAGVQVDGYGTPGLLNAPNVHAFTYGTNGAWDAAAKTGQNVLDDVLAMIALLQGSRKFGPYRMYVPISFGNALGKDFKTNTTGTVLQRILALNAGSEVISSIKVADQLPANRVILMQMTSDVVDMVDGQAPTVIPWTSIDGFVLYWMVMAIMVPRVRDDYDAQSGIVVGNV